MPTSLTSNREFRTRALELVLVAAMLAILSAPGAVPSWAQATPDKAAEKSHRAAADSSAKSLADLPPAVLPAISSALGRDDAQYGIQETADGYSAQNAANHLAARYAAKGVEIRSQNANLGFEFVGWGYGEHPANKNEAAVSPSVNANRAEYRRGVLTEWYVNGPLGLEQGFTISQPPVTLPDSNHDALDIALRLRGNLSASVERGRHALVLRDQKGVQALRYGPLLVYDASGRELESWMELQESSLRLRVNTTGARYPIIVDPWVLSAQLTVSSTFTNGIGRSVAVGGNTVVVGAPTTTVVGNVNHGAVFVFVAPTPGDWAAVTTYTAELTASNGAVGDDFGLSVGIDAGGDTIVVGAPQTQGSGGTGVAYVFVEPKPGGWGTTSTYNAELTADDVSLFGEFGWSVGIDASGDTVVVGAFATPFGFNNPNNEKGEAYVFVAPTPGGWAPGPHIQNAKLIASDGMAGDSLGISVGINESGDTVVAGAVDATVTAQYQGAAYVFVDPGPTPADWVTPTTKQTFNAKLIASDATADSHLGWSVGISGNTVVAGAYQANIGFLAQGAAYVFVAPGGVWATPPPTFSAKLAASDGAAKDEFGTSVGISGSTVVVGAASTAGGVGTGAAAAYVFVEPTPSGWTTTSTSAELPNGTAGNMFGNSVAINGNTVVVGAPAATNMSAAPGAAYVFTGTVPTADLFMQVFGTAGIGNVGLNSTFDSTVINNGPDDATNVVVTYTFSVPVYFAAFTLTLGTPSCTLPSAGTTITSFTCNLGSVTHAQGPVNPYIFVTPLTAGTLTVTAQVSADQFDPNLANNSSTASETIASTSFNLTVTANNATRAYGAANPTFTGTITGAQNGDSFVETFSTTATAGSPVGAYSIVPAVTGANSSSTADLIFYTVIPANGSLTVTQAGVSVQLSTSASGSVADGTPVILTAQVIPATSGTPTGTITFFNGLTSLGQGQVTLSQGTATLTVSTLPPGTDTITTTYSGDMNFAGLTSGPQVVAVNNPDYTVSVPTADETLTLAAGQASPAIPITVTPNLTYTGTVTFSCGTLPAYITCTFNPTSGSLTFASGATAAQQLTLTVAVASTIGMLERSSPVMLAMAMPLGLLGFLPFVGKKRKRLRLYLGIVALSLTAAGAITGCASASSSSNLPPAGTQNVTVTGGSGGISHKIQLAIMISN
jgi:hypothetical protein